MERIGYVLHRQAILYGKYGLVDHFGGRRCADMHSKYLPGPFFCDDLYHAAAVSG